MNHNYLNLLAIANDRLTNPPHGEPTRDIKISVRLTVAEFSELTTRAKAMKMPMGAMFTALALDMLNPTEAKPTPHNFREIEFHG
jgi:hypothetical protein